MSKAEWKQSQIVTYFKNNSIFIIDGLADNDLQTAKRLYEDLKIKISTTNYGHCYYRKVNDSLALFNVLNEILERVKLGLRPIIHIEAHGDMTNGLQISGKNDFVSWKNLLVALQRINKNSFNNTGLSLPLCYGLDILRDIDIEQPSPFLFIVAPSGIIKAGIVESTMIHFYTDILQNRSLESAKPIIIKSLHIIFSEQIFHVIFMQIFKNKFVGKGKESFINHILTELSINKKINPIEDIKGSRKSIKTLTSQPDFFFKKYGKKFMHGKMNFDFNEVKNYYIVKSLKLE